MSLFVLMCMWAIDGCNVFLWVWSVLQWNVMGRCVNVEPLALHNFKVFEDHIQILYDTNKTDQTGEKVTIKNIYANPINPHTYNTQYHMHLTTHIHLDM